MKLNTEHWSEESKFYFIHLQLDIIDILLDKNILHTFIK